ncbi:Kinase, CMGC [Spironucleus salmonicida]|uniref:Kinase, CMGC n=1 Tax=Spironucleus salmonicida TaxID=348837 RepID=V6LI09_9EUKA|nr:Kinase, CMGC [Spironucleus salmonicida]|eukprot:EST43346.1 Kinase, CMGC [Spironucleus salmonicida]
MTTLAKYQKYTITNEKRGEGSYGAVYSGYNSDDKTIKYAFKFMKETSTTSGLVSPPNIRELIFLAEATFLYQPQTSPFIPLIDVIPSKFIEFYEKQNELTNCIVLVLPNYEADFSTIIYSQALDDYSIIEALFLFQKILTPINHMHQLGFAHRDLKHGNILTDKYWNLKLIDFGMVQYLKETYEEVVDIQQQQTTFQPLTHSGAIATLWWRAPEQSFSASNLSSYFKLYRKNGIYNDSFAIGIMCLEAVSGVILFKQENKQEEISLAQLLATQFWVDRQVLRGEFLQQVEKKLDFAGQQAFCDYLQILNDGEEVRSVLEAFSRCRYSLQQLVYKFLVIRFCVKMGKFDIESSIQHQHLFKQVSDVISKLMSIEVTQRWQVSQALDLINDLTSNLNPDKFNKLIKNSPVQGKNSKRLLKFSENLKDLGFRGVDGWFNVFKVVCDIKIAGIDEAGLGL